MLTPVDVGFLGVPDAYVYNPVDSDRPRTRSKNPEVRAFCFVYAAMMYNA